MNADVRLTGLTGATPAEITDGSSNTLITVRIGESTLAHVAERLGVSLDGLLQANPQIADPGNLKAGQDVRLPQGQPVLSAPLADTKREAELPTFRPALPSNPEGRGLDRDIGSGAIKGRLNFGFDIIGAPNLAKNAVNQFTSAPYLKTLFDSVAKSKGYAWPGDGKPVADDQKADFDKASTKLKNDFKAAEQFINKGNYAEAKKLLEQTLQTEVMKGTNGEGVMNFMKGVGGDAVAATRTLIGQLEFARKMQAKGIPTDFPPTESQLKAYFAKFASPSQPADAKKAFKEYVDAFHVHVANESGNADADVVYSPDAKRYAFNNQIYQTSQDAYRAAAAYRTQHPDVDPDTMPISDVTTKAADSWDDVTKNRTRDTTGQYAGKNVNDCEGYAYLAETLLGAAGFKSEGYYSGLKPPDGPAHVMVVMSDSTGKQVVASNDELFDESNVKLGTDKKNNRRELLDAGWQSGAGVRQLPSDYFGGPTSADSQAAMSLKAKNHRLP